MLEKVHTVSVRLGASDGASGRQNVQRNHRLVISLARGYFARPRHEEGDTDAAFERLAFVARASAH
jgi:hypothetical protein